MVVSSASFFGFIRRKSSKLTGNLAPSGDITKAAQCPPAQKVAPPCLAMVDSIQSLKAEILVYTPKFPPVGSQWINTSS